MLAKIKIFSIHVTEKQQMVVFMLPTRIRVFMLPKTESRRVSITFAKKYLKQPVLYICMGLQYTTVQYSSSYYYYYFNNKTEL